MVLHRLGVASIGVQCVSANAATSFACLDLSLERATGDVSICNPVARPMCLDLMHIHVHHPGILSSTPRRRQCRGGGGGGGSGHINIKIANQS